MPVVTGLRVAAVLALVGCLAADAVAAPRRQRRPKGPAPAVVRLPRQDQPKLRGWDVEALAGMLAIPSAVDPRTALVDRYGGARLGYRWTVLERVRLGVEGAWRSTLAETTGTQPLAPVALFPLFRLAGGPHQVLRQSNQASGGGTLGVRLQRTGWFVEPLVQAGLSTSLRVLLVGLDSPLPYWHGTYPSAGGYAGAGLITGLLPLLFRFDALVMQEAGPPPFTSHPTQIQYNISAGARF